MSVSDLLDELLLRSKLTLFDTLELVIGSLLISLCILDTEWPVSRERLLFTNDLLLLL